MGFSAEVGGFAKLAKETADKITRATTLELFSGVIKATPVGDPDGWQTPAPPGYVGGRARGNWQASVGAQKDGEIDRIDKSGAETIADMERILPAEAGNEVFLSNSLPYIEALENGHSQQAAPGAMVRKNIARASRIAAAAIAKNRI